MTRYCLWGGRRGSVQIGSPTDRHLQLQCQWIASVERLMRVVGRGVKPALVRTLEAFEAIKVVG